MLSTVDMLVKPGALDGMRFYVYEDVAQLYSGLADCTTIDANTVEVQATAVWRRRRRKLNNNTSGRPRGLRFVERQFSFKYLKSKR